MNVNVLHRLVNVTLRNKQQRKLAGTRIKKDIGIDHDTANTDLLLRQEYILTNVAKSAQYFYVS